VYSNDSTHPLNKQHNAEETVFKKVDVMARPTEEDKKGDEWDAGMRWYGVE
jgi:hypothetical protein